MSATAPPSRPSSQLLQPSSSHLTLAQQQQQQLQDIKPGLLAQSSLAYRQQKFTYKDKFQSLRERYDQVSAINDALQKELATARTKMQKLEAENNLLIDGIGIIAPFEDAIEHYMHVQDALSLQNAPGTATALPRVPPASAPPSIQPSSANGVSDRVVIDG